MSNNVHEWKVVLGNTVLGQVLSFVEGLDQVKVTSKALDGTVYIQTVGAPTHNAKVSVFSSREEKDLLDAAEASGALIQVTYRDTVYLGYVESKLQWQTIRPGKWYNAEMNLLIEEEKTK
jgi:hypothetical protein